MFVVDSGDLITSERGTDGEGCVGTMERGWLELRKIRWEQSMGPKGPIKRKKQDPKAKPWELEEDATSASLVLHQCCYTILMERLHEELTKDTKTSVKKLFR